MCMDYPSVGDFIGIEEQWKIDTNHAFNSPRWVGGLGIYAYAIVQGNPKVRTSANQDSDWIRVRGVLGQEGGRAFQRVCATSQGTRDGTGDIGKDLDSGKRNW